ncbi:MULTISPECIES: hypothetical protein [Micromonospora]|uniref:Uncharacterized protein n=1 Tax=Micromonospora solifontis TaxID=2487138 RepID=A0ABX9W8P7_9ACTN|nr:MULTISPECIES: hypothetical protein [Micromonospora]NES14186.1 hypothetical protein [Micromonospora sp. PPF5-17B]NES39574.1 hypothetical protein [Micromonospora solifontis]NES55865.1 hypothetical protein [Micromonospora sp. PPF5-6]RNL88031.1 hypothetical protein EFE23_26200 [Micromonospora solifontis]
MSRTPNPCDNQPGGLKRPMAVGEDELERALRETFAGRVATPRPLAADPAGVAIRRARRSGRRRALTGLALAGAATVLVTTGMAQLGGPAGHGGTPIVVLGDPRGFTPSPLPTASPRPPAAEPVRAELDLIVGSRLETSGGEQRELTGVGRVERAQRVPDYGGWLVTSAATAAGRTLWWVPPNGSAPQVLLAGAEAVVVAPDGRQVAWRDGPEILAAGVVGGQLVATSRTAAPEGALPIGFAADAVLIRQPGHGVSLWARSAGGQPGAAARDVLDIYGVLPDGRLVGAVSTGTSRRPCLALLDPTRNLAPVRTGCGPDLADDGAAGVSPDGKWLLVNATRTAALLVDLRTLGTAVSTHPAGPAVIDGVVWTTAGVALHVDAAGRLVRVRPDRVVAGERPAGSPVAGVTADQRLVVVAGTTP